MRVRVLTLGDKSREPLGAHAVSLCDLLGPPAECGIKVDKRSVKVKEGKVLHAPILEPADKALRACGEGSVEGWADRVDVALMGPLGQLNVI